MKKLVVKMEFELEVPDDVVLREPAPDIGEMILVQDRYLEPALTWIALDEILEDGTWSLTSPDEEMLELMQGYLKLASSNMHIFEKQ